ncbi:hypothetical protein [Roseateles asaccharophilus]|uniref:Uncharacterized protein n=1 Tax=Roseateles asaccharophilus TaxID=582607 RepID=A0ABU2A9I2_9BURK|nr:hypothetical protein [Roseateles asaccharophilus]MDR7333854.1 hypothetical protein [Roseateles asaccharophilus]
MAKAHIDLSATELSAKVISELENKLDGKTFNFKTTNAELDLDGKFIDTVRWQAKLWETVVEASGVKSPGKPRKITSNLEEPGTYNVELELWDRVLKFKVAIAAPASGDKTPRAIKRNSKPPHVKVHLRGANLKACPANFVVDLKDLMTQMGKTASYSYVGGGGSSGGWDPRFAKHQCHEQPGKGWKAYIDEPSMGTGTTWRLYFELDFDIPTKTLNVNLTQVSQDH